mmetsp:Transcript_13513/g.15741  ORF Transcript_13513/g.15741 Transcript_13513/m.15741 type:complete len:127 (+) Transcript_13513:479-859(+)
MTFNIASLLSRQLTTPSTRSYSTRFAHQHFPSFTKSWLSDPSVYPLFVIMAGALGLMTGAGFHALTTYDDVQISPSKRNSILRYWGNDHGPSLTQQIVGRRGIGPEGLGVNHEEWKKSKDEYQKPL